MQRQLVRSLLAVCASAGALALGQEARAASPYVVDGVTLAHSLWLPRAYQCSPSDQFAQHTWCRLSRHEKGRHGAFIATTSVLRDQGRTVAYVSREIAPAYFEEDDVEGEIRRLSSRLGTPAREMRLPAREGAPTAVIVVWGKLQLEQVTGKAAETDSSEQSLLVDYLGDVPQSRRAGLPVFRLTGGAGYLWSASDRNGRGHLRFLTANPGALAAAKAATALPAPTTESTNPVAKGRAQVAAASKEGALPASAEREAAAPMTAKDLRPFLAPQAPAMLSGGAPNQEMSYPKDSSRVSIAQKARPDAERARIMDAERQAAEEREKARFAWARLEAERAADARARLKWTVVAAFFVLSAILALLQMLKRREELAALPGPQTSAAKDDAPTGRGVVRRVRGDVGVALAKLRTGFASNSSLAAQGQG
jgi:hypothetical protein